MIWLKVLIVEKLKAQVIKDKSELYLRDSESTLAIFPSDQNNRSP